MAQKIEDLTEFKNFFAELFQIISRFVLAKKKFGVRCTLNFPKIQTVVKPYSLIPGASNLAILVFSMRSFHF